MFSATATEKSTYFETETRDNRLQKETWYMMRHKTDQKEEKTLYRMPTRPLFQIFGISPQAILFIQGISSTN